MTLGPRDLRQLPEFFGQPPPPAGARDQYDIQIVAEINHAPRLARDELLRQAAALSAAGADIIDVGCEPSGIWSEVGDAVGALRSSGYRVSIDSFEPREIEPAVRAGAELVLSVNATNRAAARDWGCEVVVVPDDIATLGGLDETLEQLDGAGVPWRLDPILEPIGCGFAASLERYAVARRRYPNAELFMGIGNLTELTDVDSAGVNVLLMGFCQELGIRSVLTTQVINWARTSVQECDLARRLVHFAVRQGTPPKNVEPRLVALRDPRLRPFGETALQEMAAQLKDPNFRIYAENGWLHLFNAHVYLCERDPFVLFEKLRLSDTRPLDPDHAFYLGYELAKAATALTLGKEYRQDEALEWGYLTVPEPNHRRRRPESRA